MPGKRILLLSFLLIFSWVITAWDSPLLAQSWIPAGPIYLTGGYNPSVQRNNGRIWAMAVDPSNTQHILIDSDSGGIWQTTNGGSTWTPQTDNYPSFNVSANNNSGGLAFCAGTPSVVYANTQPAEDGWGGVIKSTDGGSTWTEVATYNTILGSNYYLDVRDLIVDPSNPNNVEIDCGFYCYCPSWGKYGGVYKSTDGGTTWSHSFTGAYGLSGPSLLASSSSFSDQYFGNSSTASANATGLYRTTNGGTSWAAISGPWNSLASLTNVWCAISPSNPSVLYVITNGNGSCYGANGFYMTSNAWAAAPTWTTLTTPMSSPDGFTVNPTNSNLVYIDFYNYYGSTCGPNWSNYEYFDLSNGATSAWIVTGSGSTAPFHADGRDLCWQGSNLLASCDGGIFKSTDGGNTFNDSINEGGLQTMLIYEQSGAIMPGHPTSIMGGGCQDNGTQLATGGGVFNEKLIGGDGWSGQQSIFGDTLGYFAWVHGTVSRSFNGWGTTAQVGSLSGIKSIARSLNNQNYVIAGAGGVLHEATDFWSNPTASSVAWNSISPTVLTSGGASATISYVQFAPSDTTNKTIALMTADNQIWTTSNGGTSWNGPVTSGLPNRNLTQITFDPTNSNILYVVLSGYSSNTPSTPGHIFRTTNALAANPTWTKTDDGVDIPHNCIVVDPNSPTDIYVGTDIGMLYSMNSGTNWTAMNPATTGMPNANIGTLIFDKPTGILTAWTFGRGIFQLDTSHSATATSTQTHTMTSTMTRTATATSTNTPGSTSTFTNTVTSTSTQTVTVTHTVTSTVTNSSTQTVTQTPANSSTSTATSTSSSTSSPANTSTNTQTATDTLTLPNTATSTTTSSSTPTATPTVTQTPTASATHTTTQANTATATAIHSMTSTNTSTPTSPNTASATATLSMTASSTATNLNTTTGTATRTSTATTTCTSTSTSTKTVTTTATSTQTHTVTQTNTPNLTLTPLANCPGIPDWNSNTFAYTKGQVVGFNGHYYTCAQNHTSNPALYPSSQPSLWLDMGPCGTTPTPVTGIGTPVIYPNPNPGTPIHIAIPITAPTNVTVKIYTLSFRRIQQTTYTDLIPGTDVVLPLADSWGHRLANGLYYIEVVANGKSSIGKLLVIQ